MMPKLLFTVLEYLEQSPPGSADVINLCFIFILRCEEGPRSLDFLNPIIM